jgi:hypothetical protein
VAGSIPAPAARAVFYGDSAYGTGANLAWLDAHGLTPMVTAQVPTAPGGRFAKDQFRIDLQAQTVTCPAQVTVAIILVRRGGRRARFGVACSVCPLRQACTTSVRGRVVAVNPREAELAAGRVRQRQPAWRADYRATRPQGGAQAGPPAAPPPRRPPRASAGPHPRRPRLEAVGRRDQPGPLRRPRLRSTAGGWPLQRA